MNTSVSHPRLVIGMILFPGLASVDISGRCEVFARKAATTVHLVAETWQPGGDKCDGDLGNMTLSNRSIR